MCANGHPVLEPHRYFADFIDGRRGEILDAALAVFGQKGYEAGTMREIAARVGVSEPAIYRHYESKEAILGDMVATAGSRIADQMRSGFAMVTGDNVVEMLHKFIDMRRTKVEAKRAARRNGATGAAVPEALHSGAGGVMHVLMHAAPHNETFTKMLRSHLGQPMVEAVRELIPRVDADFGISRTPDETEARARVFMSLFAGYFTTSLLFDESPNDDAVVAAMLAIMDWEPTDQTS